MDFLSTLSHYNSKINSFIWGNWGLSLLIFSGVFLSFLLKFFQVLQFKLWWKVTFCSLFSKKEISHSKDKSSISQFQSLCTALAATLGVGNIVGVTTAICIGGPGAVFWMWVASFAGMMTGYSENVLGIYFRRKNFSGEWSGGAMYYLRDGLGNKMGFKIIGKILASFFALFTLLASFGIGSMGQVNKIVLNIMSAFPVDGTLNTVLYDEVTLYSILIGAILSLTGGIIIIGGIKRIAGVNEKLVPAMVMFYITGSLIVIAKNYLNIIPAFKSIFSSAFSSSSILGATTGVGFGTVFQQGFKRGVFSNEAGLGSSVIIHANSSITEPAEQGMWAMFENFVDTIVMCTMTALVVLTSGVYDISSGVSAVSDSTMVASAFNSVFSYGDAGKKFVSLAILLFAFTTVLGWNHYGAKSWEYLFGTRYAFIYKIIHIASIMCGSLLTSSLAWDISDTFNGLMMIPNLIGVVLLSPLVVKITKNYIDRNIRGKSKTPMLSAFSDIQKRNLKS